MSSYSNQSQVNQDLNKEINFNLPNTIRNITFHFVKVHYHKYLEDNNLTVIENEKLKTVVDDLYEEKESELKKYIKLYEKNFPDYDKNFTLKTSTEELS